MYIRKSNFFIVWKKKSGWGDIAPLHRVKWSVPYIHR